MDFKNKLQLFFILLVIFIAFTIIGTLSHEFGHYFVAMKRGFDVKLHFDHVTWGGREASKIDNFWIALGGPLQTMGTGSIAFLVLLRKKLKNQAFGRIKMDWLWLFLSLFWLRQILNLLVSVFLKISGKKVSYFGGDEAFISSELGLPEGFLSVVTALLALFICAYLYFNILPKTIRITFLLSGLIGSALGFWLWFEHMGPKFLN